LIVLYPWYFKKSKSENRWVSWKNHKKTDGFRQLFDILRTMVII
jgi:hypothetical protein